MLCNGFSLRVLALVLLWPFLTTAVWAQSAPEPDGYRMDRYRDLVPETLAGATVLDPEQAHALWESGNVGFIDVLPRPPKPPKLPKGTIWRERPRLSIPGATWLPNVGYGALAEAEEVYFRTGLEKISQGKRSYPLVFFCSQDCWMSWNAAKRALEYGYTKVYWFPDGSDGWDFFGYPLKVVLAAENKPVPVAAE